MFDKINIKIILKDHFDTFSDVAGNTCVSDYVCFILCPVAIACISIYFRYGISTDAISALINFGSITTALLLSVLMLVFDQDRKLVKDTDKFYERKKVLFQELYSNICYSVIASISLVLACLLNIVFGNTWIPIIEASISIAFFTPFIIFISCNLILTIFMVTKRIYATLTIDKP